jgi:hypothetical protein
MKASLYITSIKKGLKYPLLFGIIGTFMGVVLRYAFTGAISEFPFKYVIHSHSHVLLLGFLFNALLLLVWTHFTDGIDKVSYKYYMALQGCVALFMIAFILQGYAFYSILFSTLHLWISYILVIRLWKRLSGDKAMQRLIKIGILFHFTASLGPYMLGPLMAMKMHASPWYQQAIFFYLHFQYFGVFFVWMLAVLLQKTAIKPTKKDSIVIGGSLVLLFAHSLDYSFDYWLIQVLGAVGSIALLLVLLQFAKHFIKAQKAYRYIYYSILLVAITNIVGSIPSMANLVIGNRFLLIAWLHLLFLGMYTPFIWVAIQKRIPPLVWFLYGSFLLFSETILIFPMLSQWLSISVMWLLFWGYLGVFLCICFVHIKFLLEKEASDIQPY